MKTKTRWMTLWITVSCLVTALFPAGFSGAEGTPESVPGSVILAERVVFSQLSPGDEFLIVNEPGKITLSLYPFKEKYIGETGVTLAHTETRKVLVSADEDAAVFTYEPKEDGTFLLKSRSGYLSTGVNGAQLFYSETPEEYSVWRVNEDEFLHNVNASYTTKGETYTQVHLEYRSEGPCFNAYSMFENSNKTIFRMAFYRLGNSLPEEKVSEDAYYKLPLFYTSDVHGYLANYQDGVAQYLLAYISDKVKDVRGRGEGARKDYALLLDGGDIFQGNTLSTVLNGNALSAAFDMMGYDAVTVGNHEFDWGLENVIDMDDGTLMDYRVQDHEGENKIPVIVCNLYRDGEKVTLAGETIILEKTARDREGNELPVRIGVIGFSGQYGNSISPKKFTAAGYSIMEDYDYVRDLACELKNDQGCDAVILLAHDNPYYVARDTGEENGIDLVLGGHVHHLENYESTGGLPYLEPSCNGKAWAGASLDFEIRDGKPVFVEVENPRCYLVGADPDKLLNTPENADELDENVVWLTDMVIESASKILDAEAGYLTETLKRYEYLPDGGKRSCTCGNWVASIYARAYGADVALVNSGGLRKDVIIDPETGRHVVTIGELYEMFPFDNQLYCFELTWEEFMEVLRYTMTSDGNILLTCMMGIDCYYTENGGVNAVLTKDGEEVWVDGEWRDGWKDKKIRLVVNDYCATTNRNKDGMDNPLIAWINTPRLLNPDDDKTDIEAAIDVLVKEAKENDGHLSVDTKAHFINKEYTSESGR